MEKKGRGGGGEGCLSDIKLSSILTCESGRNVAPPGEQLETRGLRLLIPAFISDYEG